MIDPCGKPQFISLASGKTFSTVTKYFQFERYDWNHLISDSLKLIHSISCKSTVWSNVFDQSLCFRGCKYQTKIILEQTMFQLVSICFDEMFLLVTSNLCLFFLQDIGTRVIAMKIYLVDPGVQCFLF